MAKHLTHNTIVFIKFIRLLFVTIYIILFLQFGLNRTGRDHGNERMNETAIQLWLDEELNPGPSGWKPSALPLSSALTLVSEDDHSWPADVMMR